MGYLSVGGEHSSEKVIERSRFITTSAHVEGEEEARAFIARISGKFKDATHNCYAYIADSTGNAPRFSDDGEPGGTAGMPILEVIKNKKLYCTAVVVTRYFGGIKLGAGGLVRAYSGSAAENLDGAEKLMYLPCEESAYTVDYGSVDILNRCFSQSDCEVKDISYSSDVTFTVAVKKELAEGFNAAIFDRLNGRIRIEKLREFVCGFKL
mgnify:FL=1